MHWKEASEEHNSSINGQSASLNKMWALHLRQAIATSAAVRSVGELIVLLNPAVCHHRQGGPPNQHSSFRQSVKPILAFRRRTELKSQSWRRPTSSR
ncbi:hypothetical protein COOONC_23236 [Cooperia oncophora]